MSRRQSLPRPEPEKDGHLGPGASAPLTESRFLTLAELPPELLSRIFFYLEYSSITALAKAGNHKITNTLSFVRPPLYPEDYVEELRDLVTDGFLPASKLIPFAIEQGHVEAMRILLPEPGGLEYVDLAVDRGNLAMVIWLLVRDTGMRHFMRFSRCGAHCRNKIMKATRKAAFVNNLKAVKFLLNFITSRVDSTIKHKPEFGPVCLYAHENLGFSLPIHEAAKNGSYEMTKVLLEAGFNVSATDDEGKTPLDYASARHAVPVVGLLLKHEYHSLLQSPFVNAKVSAMAQSKSKSFKSLAAFEEDANRLAIALALAKNHINALECLIDEERLHCDFSDNPRPPNALSYAASLGYSQVVACLIQRIQAADHSSKLGEPLSWAAEEDHTEVVDQILSKIREGEASTEATGLVDARGEQVCWGNKLTYSSDIRINHMLHDAILGQFKERSTKTAQLLISKSKNLETYTTVFYAHRHPRMTALQIAAYNGREDIVKYLLERGSDPNSQINYDNNVPRPPEVLISFLLRQEFTERNIIKTLLSNGADPNGQAGEWGWPLNYALRRENEALAKLLLDHGASINLVNDDWHTPLLLAIVLKSELSMIGLLLSKGADVNLSDLSGNTALHLACEINSTEMARMLLKKNADVNCRNKLGETPLNYALNMSNYHCRQKRELVELLLSNGADPNLSDLRGNAPLHNAAMEGELLFPYPDRSNVVKLLLDKGADVAVENRCGNTPIDLVLCRRGTSKESAKESQRILRALRGKQWENAGKPSTFYFIWRLRTKVAERRPQPALSKSFPSGSSSKREILEENDDVLE